LNEALGNGSPPVPDGSPPVPPSAPPRGGAPALTPGADPLARIVFVALVVACFAAFLITQRLKHTPTSVQDFDLTPFFSPYPSGHVKEAAISFKLEHAETVTVTIIDASGDTVATLVRDWPLARYKQLSLRWNGRRGPARGYRRARSPHGLAILVPLTEGRLAPAGEYRVHLALSHHGAVLSPQNLTLVAP
jgi:hypothetical protein